MTAVQNAPRDTAPAERTSHPAYSALVGLASLGVLLQGLWAGLFVHEGKDYDSSWVEVHATGADITIALAAIATVVAFVTMRRTRTDLVAGTAAFTVVLLLEAFLGGLIGGHSGLTAIHFPLAMALMGLAVWLPLRARGRA
jgi:heme A synthase